MNPLEQFPHLPLEQYSIERLLSTHVDEMFKDCQTVEELNETEELFLRLMDMLYAVRLHNIKGRRY